VASPTTPPASPTADPAADPAPSDTCHRLLPLSGSGHSDVVDGLLTQAEREELLQILEDRHGRGSAIVTTRVPVEQWHEVIGSATLADAILDRLVHNAHRIERRGESMRKLNARRSPPAGAL
jgi:hypothetical protein